MKKLLFLLLFPAVMFAQVRGDNSSWLVSTNNGTIISGRDFSSGLTDTTEAFNIVNHKTIYLNVMVLDSAVILIDYAASVDGSNYSAFTVKDSVDFDTDGANGFKSVDFTSTALGAGFIKFRLRTSVNQHALGTTTSTYTVTLTRKRY